MTGRIEDESKFHRPRSLVFPTFAAGDAKARRRVMSTEEELSEALADAARFGEFDECRSYLDQGALADA